MTVSFVMPAYKSRFLGDAIRSILSQTYQDWNLVVVDDCSPEDLRPIVESFADERIHYTRNARNIGGQNLVCQWNHSISFIDSDWFVLAADDDLYDPRFLETCVGLVRKFPNVNLVRSRVLQIDQCGKPIFTDGVFPEFSDKYEYLYDWLTAKSFTCIGNFMFRRSAIMALGGFLDFPCAFGSDIATPIALSGNGVANTDGMLFSFRQSPDHLSANSSRFKEKIAGITQLSLWLEGIREDYPENGTEHSQFATVYNHKYLHNKCIYDYYNSVIRYLHFKEVPGYIRECSLATGLDRLCMLLRWTKHHLF